MNADLELAVRCLRQIDALRAGVRFYDAAAAALQRPPETRRPDFDEWLTEREEALQLFVDGYAEAPAEMVEFARLSSWMLSSYRKDGKAMRLIIWVLRKVFRVAVPLSAPSHAPAGDDSAGLDASWIFVLAVAALWFAAR